MSLSLSTPASASWTGSMIMDDSVFLSLIAWRTALSPAGKSLSALTSPQWWRTRSSGSESFDSAPPVSSTLLASHASAISSACSSEYPNFFNLSWFERNPWVRWSDNERPFDLLAVVSFFLRAVKSSSSCWKLQSDTDLICFALLRNCDHLWSRLAFAKASAIACSWPSL